jgi:hypothetical protein
MRWSAYITDAVRQASRFQNWVRSGRADPFPEIGEDLSDWMVVLILGWSVRARRWTAGHEPLPGAGRAVTVVAGE